MICTTSCRTSRGKLLSEMTRVPVSESSSFSSSLNLTVTMLDALSRGLINTSAKLNLTKYRKDNCKIIAKKRKEKKRKEKRASNRRFPRASSPNLSLFIFRCKGISHLNSAKLYRLLRVVIDYGNKIVTDMHLFRVAAWVRISGWHQCGNVEYD